MLAESLDISIVEIMKNQKEENFMYPKEEKIEKRDFGPSGGMAGALSCKNTKEISSQLCAQESVLNRLSITIDQLYEHLGPVLSKSIPENTKADEVQMESDLGRLLQINNRKIIDICESIVRLGVRIQL